MTISVEVYEKDNKLHVYIGQDNSSGYKKSVDSVNEAGEVVKQYIMDNYNSK